jgi:hypothetical protein
MEFKQVTGRPGRWLAVQSGYSSPFLLGLNQFYQPGAHCLLGMSNDRLQMTNDRLCLQATQRSGYQPNLSFVICHLSSVITPCPPIITR